MAALEKPRSRDREIVAKQIETLMSLSAAKHGAGKRQAAVRDSDSAAADTPKPAGGPRQRRRSRLRRKKIGGRNDRKRQERE
jgi:hypothetical protein